MARSQLARALGAAVLALAASAIVPPEPALASSGARRPNVVLIVADDLGYADIGAHGCADIPTPSIDSLARDGVRCAAGYAAGTRCAPSRAGLLTGRYPQALGCELSVDRGLPRDQATLAQRLREAGYATGLVGKWHLGTAEEDHPLARGFDEFFGFLGGVSVYVPAGPSGVPNLLRGREPVREHAYLTDALGREAVDFVERHADEPFLLVLSFNAPHMPLQAPAAALKRFRAIEDPVRRTYAAMVATMDDAIGALLARVDQLGLADSTLVAFLGDNGGPQAKRQRNGSSNAPLRGQKGGTWEGGIRVPFLVRWSGTLPDGRTYEHAVSALDLFPTALAAAGIEPRPEWRLDGVNLIPHLSGRTSAPPHEYLFWCFRAPPRRPELHKWAVRRGDLKLVHVAERTAATGRLPAAASFGLYDVARDPGETRDLAAEQPERVRELERAWRLWCAALPAPSSGSRSD